MNPPQAKTSELLKTDLGEEVIIYDPESNRAHSLNRLAATIWRHCDGRNTIADLRRLASADIGGLIDEPTVWAALNQLEQANLLEMQLEDGGKKTLGRRELLRKAGQIGTAAVATPIVASVLVPTAAAAASAGPTPLGIFAGLAFYQGGSPPDAAPGSPGGSPDTGWVRTTNNGTGTFVGTLSFNANNPCGGGNFTPVFNVTLVPGAAVSISFNNESSNFGGYNGLCGQTTVPQDGAQFLANGTVTLGAQVQVVNFAIFDKDIHSGAFRTNPFGVSLDNYILQGGDPYGRDTGDTYEETQAPGPFAFHSV